MRRVISVCAIAALVLAGGSARAWETPPPEEQQCPGDFLTGGGWIITSGFNPTHDPAKGTLAIGGGCKKGGDGHGLWGHLEYHDHGTGLNVHWATITAYFPNSPDDTSTDPKTGQPTGTRFICGTARTNMYGDVNWSVKATDNGEPGDDDVFIIRLTDQSSGTIVYTTEGDPDHTLGGPNPGGGNIQLHKPNNSTSGTFTMSCPAGLPD